MHKRISIKDTLDDHVIDRYVYCNWATMWVLQYVSMCVLQYVSRKPLRGMKDYS